MNKNNKSYLYLLACVDCIERLDTILLEARHLQQSIIYILREPVLNLLLRQEEQYIWGGDWQHVFSDQSEDTAVAVKLAREWVVSYPETVFPEIEDDKLAGNTTTAYGLVKKRIEVIWNETGWSQIQRGHYHRLRAIQILKQQIIRDKIFFLRRLYKGDVLNHTDYSGVKKSELLILRQALLTRGNRYLDRLRDFKGQFSRAMDSGMQDHPRPSIERRRELGVYMDFLSDRTRDLRKVMTLLINYIQKKSPDHDDRPAGYYKDSSVLILHGWQHGYSSESTRLTDQVGFRKQSDNLHDNSFSHIEFINTNFWMPERPDLQPLIAHEVAHSILRDNYNNLSDLGITYNDDPFVNMLSDIYRVIDELGGEYDLYMQRDDPRGTLIEIACDLLAVTVKGMSYVYALFVETVGAELDSLLEYGDKIPVLEAIDYMHFAEDINRAQRRDWFYRVKIAIFWWENISMYGLQPPGDTLAHGIKGVLDDMLKYLDNISTTNGHSKNDSKRWYFFTDTVCDVMAKHPDTIKAFKKWHEEVVTDEFSERYGVDDPSSDSNRVYPRSTRRLDMQVRDKLFELQLTIKQGEGRLLYGETKDLLRKFQHQYGIKINSVKRYEKHAPQAMYRRLYDIPWQSALTRAMDFVDGEGDCPMGLYVHALHEDFAMGRELYELALEFYIWDTESPHTRLVNVLSITNNLIAHLRNLHKISVLSEADMLLVGELEDWVSNEPYLKGNELTYNDIQKRKNTLTNTPRSEIGSLLSERKWSAKSITKLISDVKATDLSLIRKAERLAGLKLNELRGVLGGEYKKKPMLRLIKPLRSYLSVRQSGGRPQFFEFMLNRMTITDKYVDSIPNRYFSHLTIDRISVSDSGVGGQRSCSMSLGEFLKKEGSWNCSSGQGKNAISQVVIGRYDAITLVETKPLYRCPLPGFAVCRDVSEAFPTYFSRRESAIKIDFFQKRSLAEFVKMQEFVAIISVTLQRRSYRLDFLHKLLNLAKKPSDCEYEMTGSIIEDFTDIFSENDYACLTDGWGDVVIMFTGKVSLERLKTIFNFQSALYEDFMVDRTELIFTPVCADIVALKDVGNNVQIRTHVRLKEDRDLRPTNEIFEDTVAGNIANKISSKILPIKSYKLYKSPGRMDYYLNIVFDEWQDYHCKKVYSEIIDILDSDVVDRIDTSINYLRQEMRIGEQRSKFMEGQETI